MAVAVESSHLHTVQKLFIISSGSSTPEKVVKKTRARYKVDGKHVTKKQCDEAIANENDNVEYIPKKEIEEIVKKTKKENGKLNQAISISQKNNIYS